MRRLEVTLRPIRAGRLNCRHPRPMWGRDPGTVACECGAKWRATLVKREPAPAAALRRARARLGR